MAWARDLKVTVRERLQRDPSFREGLLEEAVDCLLSSDVETGKSLLRDYVNATIGFGGLGDLTEKSLHLNLLMQRTSMPAQDPGDPP